MNQEVTFHSGRDHDHGCHSFIIVMIDDAPDGIYVHLSGMIYVNTLVLVTGHNNDWSWRSDGSNERMFEWFMIIFSENRSTLEVQSAMLKHSILGLDDLMLVDRDAVE